MKKGIYGFSGNEKFGDYFESFGTTEMMSKDVAFVLNYINAEKFDSLFSVKEVVGVSDDNEKEWNVSYARKESEDRVIDFNVELKKGRQAVCWRRESTLHGHFVSNQFCDRVVSYFGGHVCLSTDSGIFDDGVHFHQEFSTFDGYMDFILLSGYEQKGDSGVFADHVKEECRDSLGEVLYSALNNGSQFNI